MSTLLLDPPRERHELLEGRDDRLFAIDDYSNGMEGCGGLTLDDLITGLWEGLSLHRTVNCPACGGAMKLSSAAAPCSPEAACIDCGASIC
jgi:hypothetical protein